MMRSCALLALSVLMPPLALAHHSFAMFDMGKDLSITGSVRQFLWESPHSWLQILTQDPAGKKVEWSVEMGAPNSLYRHGWRQLSFKPGDKVTVVVHPLRDGRAGGSLVSAVLADGAHLSASGGSAVPAGAAEKKP
jgi:hypothetical protein